MSTMNQTSISSEVIGSLARAIWADIRKSGYTVERVYEGPDVFLAEKPGARFYFALRMKGEPSYRRKTKEYEYGVDEPDMKAYLSISTADRIPGDPPTGDVPVPSFIIFFPTATDNTIYFGELHDIVTHARHWQDRHHFPAGIYFIGRKHLEKLGYSE